MCSRFLHLSSWTSGPSTRGVSPPRVVFLDPGGSFSSLSGVKRLDFLGAGGEVVSRARALALESSVF